LYIVIQEGGGAGACRRRRRRRGRSRGRGGVTLGRRPQHSFFPPPGCHCDDGEEAGGGQ